MRPFLRLTALLVLLSLLWAAFSPLFGQGVPRTDTPPFSTDTVEVRDTVFIHDTTYLPPPGFHGLTFCRNGMVEMWVRDPRIWGGGMYPTFPSNIAALEWEGIIAHERTHVAQYVRYPNCNMAEAAWNTAPTDSSLSLEAEAYCNQAKVFLDADAMEPGELTGRLLLRLLRKAPERDAREVLELFYGVCPVLRPEEK